jgi:diaminopropionate ammonia-lyase
MTIPADRVPTRHFHNPRADRLRPYGELGRILSSDGFAVARREIASWPGYAPTPLEARPGLAAALGLGALWYKDEAPRFGLGSFKALGGAYAVFRLLQETIERRGVGRNVTAADLLAGRYREATAEVTVTCATAGNHGRSVAWGARRFGCRCVIFLPAQVSEGRAAALADLGAEVVRLSCSYDDAVRHAAAEAAANGWAVVSDTAYAGNTESPRDVMHGYGTMADEAAEQVPEVPTHVFLQAGVGALAAAVCARFWQRWGALRPRLVVVEPASADCCFQSAVAGMPAAAAGDLATAMGGLSCREVSPLAWEVLSAGADDFLTIGEEWAVRAMRRLASGTDGDKPLVAGETGAAGLAALLAVCAEPPLRVALDLGSQSRVLLFGSEGATDPERWRSIVGTDPRPTLRPAPED